MDEYEYWGSEGDEVDNDNMSFDEYDSVPVKWDDDAERYWDPDSEVPYWREPHLLPDMGRDDWRLYDYGIVDDIPANDGYYSDPDAWGYNAYLKPLAPDPYYEDDWHETGVFDADSGDLGRDAPMQIEQEPNWWDAEPEQSGYTPSVPQTNDKWKMDPATGEMVGPGGWDYKLGAPRGMPKVWAPTPGEVSEEGWVATARPNGIRWLTPEDVPADVRTYDADIELYTAGFDKWRQGQIDQAYADRGLRPPGWELDGSDEDVSRDYTSYLPDRDLNSPYVDVNDLARGRRLRDQWGIEHGRR